MSLRSRIALTIGGLALLLVLALVVIVSASSGSNLRSAIDDQLATRAELFSALAPERQVQLLDIIYTDPLDPQIDAELSDLAVRLQVIDRAGVAIGATDVPVDLGVVTDVLRTGVSQFRTIDVGDRRLRVLTVAAGDGVVQVATDVTALEDGLTTLRRTTLAVGMIGAAVAVSSAMVGSSRLVKPVREMTVAANTLQPGRDLPVPIDSQRTDEVGVLAASFNTMVAKLELSRVQQERLVADASHELRTPLTSLRLKLDFMASQPDVSAERRQQIVADAAVELEALSELIDEVTDLASLSAKPESLEVVDLGELIQDVARRSRITTGRAISTHATGGRFEIRPQMVRRAVANLIVNAHKYTPAGAPIEIHQTGERIEVRDRGEGFDVAERDRAFDRFFRGRATQHIGGSGIGLAIVKQVAEIHHGDVWIDDGPSGGAAIGFSISRSDC